ncbi:hypothetical protein [Methyloversatilis sp.]|uniref:hypothetical protein n=1 Tax=Methyloversatilis sp. TaxID=2569862 RepID=UPI0035B12565
MKSILPDAASWEGEINLIPEELRVEEAALMGTRWFDYHDLLPGQATVLFALTYNLVAQRFWEKTQDADNPMKCPAVITQGLMVTQCEAALWRARQEADRLCCRYEFMIEFVFERFLSRGLHFTPRPNQMYSEEILLDLKDAIATQRSVLLETAKNEFFLASNYVGDEAQDRYRTYLIDYVKSRERGRQHGILSRLISDGSLTHEFVEQFFEPEVMSRIFDHW